MSVKFCSSARRPRRFGCDAAQNERGFTLIQLLFVVAIVIVLSAIAVPSFLNSSRPMRIRNDANALADLVTMARMRAATEFSHAEVYCTPAPASGPANCQLRSLPYPGTGSWIYEPQTVYLSSGVSFGIPTSITTPVPNQTSTGAYQGDAQQYTPLAAANTANPVIVFNSRGLPVDPTGTTGTNGTVPTADYVFYLKDTAGNYYAVAANLTGRPALYTYANGVFTCLRTSDAAPCGTN
jgi:type II secretory pathway pseudopilin PulG